jgi:hypothetical protein
MVVLQKCKEVKTAPGAIRRRLTMRMDSWEAEIFEMLVQDTEKTALAQLSRIQGSSRQISLPGLSSKASFGQQSGG